MSSVASSTNNSVPLPPNHPKEAIRTAFQHFLFLLSVILYLQEVTALLTFSAISQKIPNVLYTRFHRICVVLQCSNRSSTVSSTEWLMKQIQQEASELFPHHIQSLKPSIISLSVPFNNATPLKPSLMVKGVCIM